MIGYHAPPGPSQGPVLPRSSCRRLLRCQDAAVSNSPNRYQWAVAIDETGRRIKYLGVWKGDTVKRSFTAVIEHEGDGYVALCPELDIASQGSPIEEARTNLVEAVELFLETASAAEIDERLHEEV